METVVDSNILEKLKKLLTLSRGASGAEAETALAMAMKLATKNAIDISSIELADAAPKKEAMVQDGVECGQRMSVAQRWISWILQDHFNVAVIYSGSRWAGRRIYLLGRKSDVEFAKYVQDFLREHMLRSWQYYQKSHNVSTRERNSYFSGFYRGLSTKLRDAKEAQEKESFAAVAAPVRANAESKYALAIVSEKEERQQYVSQQFPVLRRAASSTTYKGWSAGANKAGFNAGQTTNIARPLK